MVSMANFDIPSEFLRRFISSAIHIIIQISRQVDGKRRLISLQEITGMEGNIITTQEVFHFKQTRVDADGNVRGRFQFNGIRPKFLEKFKIAGIKINNEQFSTSFKVEV